MNKSFIQFLKFGVVGVSNTLISLAIYYLFLWIDPSFYLIGNVAGFIVSVANAYYWNNKYVFGSTNSKLSEKIKIIIKTYLSYGFTFLLSTILLYIQVDLLNISEVIAPIVNLIITIPLNFLLNKFWTFRK